MQLELATLLYHEVTDDPTSSGFQRPTALPFKHDVRTFAEHLDIIAAAGRIPVLASEIDFSGSGRQLLLTFDDGGASALSVSDALARRGWKAHFFVTTCKLGSRTFIDAAGVRALRAAGHVVGTHSHSHPNVFRALTRADMLREWRESRDRLEQILGEPVRAGSVPGGDSSLVVEQTADAVGLRWLFSSQPELRPRRVGRCWVLGRACIKTTTSRHVVRRLVAFDGWGSAWLAWQAKDVARTVLDPAYRRWVRSRETETG